MRFLITPKKKKTRNFIGMMNVLEFSFTADGADFPAHYGEIQNYCVRSRIPDSSAERIQVVFEEMCFNILIGERGNISIDFKIGYLPDEGKTELCIRYDGDEFNPSDSENIIALKLLGNAADEIRYEAEIKNIYTNRIDITITDKKSE